MSERKNLVLGDTALLGPDGYAAWLTELKQRVHAAQQRAALSVNRELVMLYWQIGRDILVRQEEEGWGAKIIDQLAHDLKAAFPEMKGFSPRNLKYMRAFAAAWQTVEVVQQAAAQLPWFHLCVLLDKVKTQDAREWYVHATLEHGWSRNVLVMQIETDAHLRAGKAVTNFAETLPKPLSDLARESLKDPYPPEHMGKLGFYLSTVEQSSFGEMPVILSEAKEPPSSERWVFLGGSFRATPFRMTKEESSIALLSAVDAQVKAAEDGPTLGILLCKTKNRVVAEYALRDTKKPMGVAEYQLVASLPKDLEDSLPSVERLERELGGVGL